MSGRGPLPSAPSAALAVALFLALVLPAAAARAQDAFEIQVYDSDTAAPGQVGFEAHVVGDLVGVRSGHDGELPTQGVTHLTLEPHLGLARWCEIGGYLQTALRPDGAFDYAGVKLRWKIRLPRRIAGERIGLALNQELSAVPRTYEAERNAWELRPIAELTWQRLAVSLNPIFAVDLRGPRAGHPQLEPAARLALRTVDWLAAGVEYYAALGPVDDPAPLAAQVHRIFGVVDLEGAHGASRFDVALGLGYGLAAGERWIAKLTVGVDFPP